MENTITIFIISLLLPILVQCQRNKYQNFDPFNFSMDEVPERSLSNDSTWTGFNLDTFSGTSPVYVGSQDGLKESDKIHNLPGQPYGVDFNQYSGYVTVDPEAGRALFYYFVESPTDSSSKPLVLWLNGGPGCSSFGNGAMMEIGPFRVDKDGKTLYRNDYAWNADANIIFLESPAGVGFSYSNTTSDYALSGDNGTAHDSYVFLVNWLERFPEYKSRDFYITGESYAGHYVPQLTKLILQNNKNTNGTIINIIGFAIGNAYVDFETNSRGKVDYYWSHALISDEIHAEITSNCNFSNPNAISEACKNIIIQENEAIGNIDRYNIYASLCNSASNSSVSIVISSSLHMHNRETRQQKELVPQYYSLTILTSFGAKYEQDSIFDPCSDNYVHAYLNRPQVQSSLHANVTALPYPWESCSDTINRLWKDKPLTVLPVIQELMKEGLRIWIYSGDTDSVVPVTSTKYAINNIGVPLKTSWYPWYTQEEVGGYAVGYENLTFVTVRGAGHLVPSYQPARALVLFSSFINGELPPSS